MRSTIPSSIPDLVLDVFPCQVDFCQIMTDLANQGIGYYQQSLSIGRAWSTYQRWMDGVEPRYSDATAILRLHAAYCGPDQTEERLSNPPKSM